MTVLFNTKKSCGSVMARALGVVSLLALCLSTVTLQASTITYAWSGFAEPVTGSANPWGLTGDGSALTQNDGTPYSISVLVDSATSDQDGTSASCGQFAPASVNLTIHGAIATAANARIEFVDNFFGMFDDIRFNADVTHVGTRLFFSTGCRVPLDTFSFMPGAAVNLPPVFDSAVPIQYGGANSGFVLTYPALNGPVTATVPEPGTLALLGCGTLGLLGYGWRKRKA